MDEASRRQVNKLIFALARKDSKNRLSMMKKIFDSPISVGQKLAIVNFIHDIETDETIRELLHQQAENLRIPLQEIESLSSDNVNDSQENIVNPTQSAQIPSVSISMTQSLGVKISTVVIVLLAVLSMFLTWADVGIARASGFKNQSWILLAFFIYPVLSNLTDTYMYKFVALFKVTTLNAFMIWYIAFRKVEIFGKEVDVVAGGAYLFLICSLALYGIVYFHDNRGRERKSRLSTGILFTSILIIITVFTTFSYMELAKAEGKNKKKKVTTQVKKTTSRRRHVKPQPTVTEPESNGTVEDGSTIDEDVADPGESEEYTDDETNENYSDDNEAIQVAADPKEETTKYEFYNLGDEIEIAGFSMKVIKTMNYESLRAVNSRYSGKDIGKIMFVIVDVKNISSSPRSCPLDHFMLLRKMNGKVQNFKHSSMASIYHPKEIEGSVGELNPGISTRVAVGFNLPDIYTNTHMVIMSDPRDASKRFVYVKVN